MLIGNERKYGKGNFCAHYSSFTLFHATVIFISQRRHLGLCCCRLSIRFLEKYKMNESFIKFVSRNCDISLFFFCDFFDQCNAFCFSLRSHFLRLSNQFMQQSKSMLKFHLHFRYIIYIHHSVWQVFNFSFDKKILEYLSI